MLLDNERNADTRSVGARGFDPYAGLQAVRTTAVLWKKQPDMQLAGAHEVCNARISRLRLGGRRRPRTERKQDTGDAGGRRYGSKRFHGRLQIGGLPQSTRRPSRWEARKGSSDLP